MEFNIRGLNFYLNEQKIFLNSGEIHYFRIKRELWDKHLHGARMAGLTTVSSYVPWAWHEPEEGVFDFEGTGSAETDLKGWLQCCQENNLYCILKPGPFILAETRGAGLPEWFIHKHGKQVKMRDREGNIVQSDGVNLFHPVFLEKIKIWYDQVMPFISRQEISKGGPVIMMQVCNEIGVFSWLAHQADYGHGVKDRFVSYLIIKYGKIEEVNKRWGLNYNDFDQVELPPGGNVPFNSKGDRSRDYDWHCFWRTYYGDYLRMLIRMARERGITVPLFHNLPGWIYGHGYEFPVNITMYEDLYGDESEILFGIDHIPEFLSYRNMHDDRIINDVTEAMQGDKPLFAAEFQCGSREYHVVTNPRELELFYKASIAHGLTGWNYYMFSQGCNPRQRGYSGDTFYWFTPLNSNGDRDDVYPLISRMSKIINTCGNIIVKAKRRAEIGVLFYPPYYATELERPETGASGLHFDYAAIRRPAYFDGLLKVLQVLNVDYDMVDLSNTSGDKLVKYKQLWAFCTDEMNAFDQQVILDYVNNGGNLLIFPNLPERDMSQLPCTIIRDAISVKPSGYEDIDSPLIDICGHKDIKCANPQVTYSASSLNDAEIIARTITGSACGFRKQLGKGTVTHLGTWIGFDTEGHKAVYRELLKRPKTKLQQAFTDNDNIAVRERFTNDGSAVLFIGNYYNQEQKGMVTYTHPVSGEHINVPFNKEQMLWPALYGILTPVCREISDELIILHCTSDLLNIAENDRQIDITLYGNRDLAGEMVLEGSKTGTVKSANIEGKSIRITRKDDFIILNYKHLHAKEISLSIVL